MTGLVSELAEARGLMNKQPEGTPMTPTPVLPSLPEPFVHCYEWKDLRNGTRRSFSAAPYNGMRCSNSLALYTAEQYQAGQREAYELGARSTARPSDDALWDQTLRERDRYHEWADKLAEAISRFIGFDIGEHSNVNNPWARAVDMVPAGTLIEALAQARSTAAQPAGVTLSALVSKWRHAAEHLGLEGLASLSDCADELETAMAHSAAAQPVEPTDFSADLTKAKNLLVRIWDKHPAARSMIEGATGRWFVWGNDRAAPPAASGDSTPPSEPRPVAFLEDDDPWLSGDDMMGASS